MKKYIKALLFTIVFSFFALSGMSQNPPPPPSGGHGQSGNQQGGNAPVGSGMVILLGLGAAYGSKKVYDLNIKKVN